jgi:hypothetical protein
MLNRLFWLIVVPFGVLSTAIIVSEKLNMVVTHENVKISQKIVFPWTHTVNGKWLTEPIYTFKLSHPLISEYAIKKETFDRAEVGNIVCVKQASDRKDARFLSVQIELGKCKQYWLF